MYASAASDLLPPSSPMANIIAFLASSMVTSAPASASGLSCLDRNRFQLIGSTVTVYLPVVASLLLGKTVAMTRYSPSLGTSKMIRAFGKPAPSSSIAIFAPLGSSSRRNGSSLVPSAACISIL